MPCSWRLLGESQWKQHLDEGISLEIEDIDGLNVQLNLKTKGGKSREGWLQLLPDGRIKYTTPDSFPHPMGIVFKYGYILYLEIDDESNDGMRQRAVDYLQSNQIPLFGYAPDAPVHVRKRIAVVFSVRMATSCQLRPPC